MTLCTLLVGQNLAPVKSVKSSIFGHFWFRNLTLLEYFGHVSVKSVKCAIKFRVPKFRRPKFRGPKF